MDLSSLLNIGSFGKTLLDSVNSSIPSNKYPNSGTKSNLISDNSSEDSLIGYQDQDVSTSLRLKIEGLTEGFALFINPETMQWDLGSKRQEISNNLGGIIESNFPDSLVGISLTAKSGTFYTEEEGFTAVDRSTSPVYNKFLKFIDLLKNNASQYNSTGVVLNVNTIQINYLGVSWRGNVKSFSFDENEATPNIFTFEAQFVVFQSNLD